MSILDRILGKGTTQTAVRPTTQTAERPTTPRLAEEQLIGIAHRIVPPTDTPTHFFICSGNRSLIEAYHGLFRVGAAAYGGSAAFYRADAGTLRTRQADAASKALPFDGRRSMGSTAEEAADVAGVLGSLGAESASGNVFVAYVTVGPKGIAWVREVYTTVMGEAMGQGILPFRMYETVSADAASYLLGSFTEASAT